MSCVVKRIEPPPQPPAQIEIKVDEPTAEILCALIGGISFAKPGGTGSLSEVYHALHRALPNRYPLTFSDLFAGRLQYLR